MPRDFLYGILTLSLTAFCSSYNCNYVISLLPGLFTIFPHKNISSTNLGPVAFITEYPVSSKILGTCLEKSQGLNNSAFRT